MTPERKEIEYWLSINEVPPFVKECGIDWDNLVENYLKIKEEEKTILFQEENEKYLKALNELTEDDVEDFDTNGNIPSSLLKIVTLDSDMHFKFIKIPNMTPSTGGYIFDDVVYRDNSEKIYNDFIESYCE